MSRTISGDHVFVLGEDGESVLYLRDCHAITVPMVEFSLTLRTAWDATLTGEDVLQARLDAYQELIAIQKNIMESLVLRAEEHGLYGTPIMIATQPITENGDTVSTLAGFYLMSSSKGTS